MIRLYRLSTGEDVIGTPVEEGDPLQEGELENHIDFEYIKKPFVLIPMQGQPGQPMSIGFHPYIPYTKDEVIKIKNKEQFKKILKKIFLGENIIYMLII